MSLRQGPDLHSVNYDEAVAAGFVLPADRYKPAPAEIAMPAFDVEPSGAFSSRTAAETRAHKMLKGSKLGTSFFAVQIKDHWCVARTYRGVTEYVEG